MRFGAITLGLVLAMTGTVRAQDTTAAADTAAVMPAVDLTVEAVLTRGVMDRAPQDTVSAVAADVGNLTLWTKISGAESGTVIHHVWFRGEEQVGDVALTLGGSPWRTWSRKAIPSDWTGSWRVEVRDGAGNVLQRIAFTVGE